jgi:hypothetical protein
MSGPFRRNWSLVLWAVTLILITFALRFFSGLPVSNALLLGIMAVTLVWYFRELNVDRSYLSTIGLITLVVLLLEIDLALVSLQLWLGTLVSGLAIGIAIGFLGVSFFRRFKHNKKKISGIFFFIWAYSAYLVGLIFETSAITTTLAAALVVSTYGYSIGLWYNKEDIPVPSNSPMFFYLSAGIWLALGWQAHTVLDPMSLFGILPALVVISTTIFVSRKIVPISTKNSWAMLLRKLGSVLLLLFGAMLFWPKQAFLTTVSVEIAIGAAILLILLLRYSIKPIFEFIGVELSWPVNDSTENQNS